MIRTEKQQIGDWNVQAIVDDDGHLNVYITNDKSGEIEQIETGQGDGIDGEQLAQRFTTPEIESEYREETEQETVVDSVNQERCEDCEQLMYDCECGAGMFRHGDQRSSAQ